jgi:HK97 family phage portal protein
MALFTRARPTAGREQRTASLLFLEPPIGVRVEAALGSPYGDIESAMRQHTVWKCMRLVSDVLSCMTPVAYRGPGIGHGEANRMDSPQILVQPSADADIFDFTYMLIGSLLARGNGYGKIVEVDKYGRPAQVELQYPDRASVKQLGNGALEYRYGATVVDREQVWHKRAFRMAGSPVGLSPIGYAQGTISLSTSAQQFGSQFFSGGGHPTGIITNDTQKLVAQGEADTIKKRFLSAMHGGREPVVMGGGWQYKQLQIAPGESQFLDTQKYTGSAICGFFGVPPEVVGEASEGSSITYANVESRSLDFLKFGLGGWVARLERWYTDLLPRGQYVKLDTTQLLRSDTLTRYQALHLLVGARIITQDEARAMEDWAALTPEQQAQIDKLVTPIPPPIGSPKIGS